MIQIDNTFLLGIIILLVSIICKYLVYDPMKELKGSNDKLSDSITMLVEAIGELKHFTELQEEINEGIKSDMVTLKHSTRVMSEKVDETRDIVDKHVRVSHGNVLRKKKLSKELENGNG